MAKKENSLKRTSENVQEAALVDVTTGKMLNIIVGEDVSIFYIVIRNTLFCFNFFILLVFIVPYWTLTG